MTRLNGLGLIIAPLAALLVGFGIFPLRAMATGSCTMAFIDGFETYNNGALASQGCWGAASTCNVISTNAHSGTKSVKCGTVSTNEIAKFDTDDGGAVAGERYFWVSIDQTNWAQYYELGAIKTGQGIQRTVATFRQHTLSNLTIWDLTTGNTAHKVQENIPSNTWVKIGVKWDGTSKYWINYNDGTWYEESLSLGTVTWIQMESEAHTTVYYDDLDGGAATIDITNPVTSGATSNWNHWSISWDANTNVYDCYDATVCYGFTQQEALNCERFFDTKALTQCDGTTATESGSANILVKNILANSEYFYEAKLYGSVLDENGFRTIEPDLIAVSSIESQTYENSTYDNAGLTEPATLCTTWYGTGDWGTGICNSAAFGAVSNFIDHFIKPLIDKMASFAAFMDPDEATEYGIAAGTNINLLFKTMQNVNNFIPGFPFLYWVLFYGIVTGAIALWRWGFKIIKIIR